MCAIFLALFLIQYKKELFQDRLSCFEVQQSPEGFNCQADVEYFNFRRVGSITGDEAAALC